MSGVFEREGIKGREFVFRHNGKLYVFKSKVEAEIRWNELVNGSLF